MSAYLLSRSKKLFLDKCLVMGVLNITPDSFSDGGQFSDQVRSVSDKWVFDLKKVVAVARQMIRDGAVILDIGGESTGPGSVDVSVEEELQRVLPVLKALISDIPEVSAGEVWLSVDTYKPQFAQACLQAGVDMLNDVTALRCGGVEMARLAAESGVSLVLMYAKDVSPRTTRDQVDYDDVVASISDFLQERVEFALANGVKREQIIIDPGMGAFVSGKAQYSLEILYRLAEFKKLGFPVLIGASRKGFIGEVLGGLPVDQRLSGGLAAVALAVERGVKIVRTHDVRETVRAVKMAEAILAFGF